LYETADAKRLEELKASDDPEVAGLAEKIDREEAYHRMHAEMWFERLRDEPRFREALEELRPLVEQRGEHGPELAELWEEMTMVRRSVAGAAPGPGSASARRTRGRATGSRRPAARSSERPASRLPRRVRRAGRRSSSCSAAASAAPTAARPTRGSRTSSVRRPAARSATA